MKTTETPDLSTTAAVVLLSCMGLWILATLRKKEKSSGRHYYYQERLQLQAVLRTLCTICQHYWDESVRNSLLENLYKERRLKGIFPLGRPKLFKFFRILLVATDDITSIKDILYSNECNAKLPSTLAAVVSNGHKKGLLWNDGPSWKEMRKYSIKKLAQLGFGKSDKLSLTLSELLPELLTQMESLKIITNNKIPVKGLFVLPVINVVWCIIGGSKFSLKDEQFTKLYKNVDTMSNIPLWKAHLINFLPRNKITSYIFGYNSFYDSVSNVHQYIKEYVDDKIKSRNWELEPQDFVDHFILEIEKHRDGHLCEIYCKEQLISVLVDLFSAGMDPTSKFLEFSLMYMVLNPQVQAKIQDEIDSVIEKNCIPSYSDHRKMMPYTLATLMEVHRLSSIVPIITRHLVEDWMYEGQHLEMGTQIINIMWAIRMDESYWGDPSIFRPERFLHEDNTFIMKRMNRVMPFGAGNRMCPGDAVSTASYFTFFVGVLQKYTVTKADESEQLGIDKNCGLINQPRPFHVTLNERI